MDEKSTNTLLVDSHAHIGSEQFDSDRHEVYKDVFSGNIKILIEVGVDVPSSLRAYEFAQMYDNLYSTSGIQPYYAKGFDETHLKKIEEIGIKNKVIAIGELGLDTTYEEDIESQRTLFEKQVAIAKRINKPIIIHMRNTEKYFLEYFNKGLFDNIKGVFHCFTGDAEFAKAAVEVGFNISFSGIITFKNFNNHDIFKVVPLERVMIETDSPYLAPVPYRGKRNYPGYLIKTAEKLALNYNISLNELADITAQNTTDLFRINN